MRQNTSRTLVGITCLVAAFSLAACGGSEDKASSDSSSPAVNGANIAPPDDALTGDLVGSGCTAYNKAVPTGEGSFEGMAQLPVATAASHNPMLSTLAQAVDGKLNSSVNLTDTLNSGQFTVLAPTNDAFDKMSASTFNKLKSDKVGLANLLTYHVIAGQLSPSQLPGKQSTVEGSTLNISGSGNDMKVNGVGIVCGGVKTANATVYLIDGVLTPPATK